MNRPRVIAIDGPAGVGKSTVGQRVAERLGYFYFDTGLLYRAVTWKALACGIDPQSESDLAQLLATTRLEVRPPSVQNGRTADVLVDGQDVTALVRSPEVERAVSPVSAAQSVRRALLPIQRRIGAARPTVMAGRDIGTVVFPDAPLKVFLTASQEERARRRARQLGIAPGTEGYRQVLAELERRDRLDTQRAEAPLRPAPDAVQIDTTAMTVDQVVERIVELARQRGLA